VLFSQSLVTICELGIVGIAANRPCLFYQTSMPCMTITHGRDTVISIVFSHTLALKPIMGK